MRSSKLILILSLLIVFTSFLTLVAAINKYGFTGRASDTGIANITIDIGASISFTDAECNFGSGSVNETPDRATINSSGYVENGTGWTGCTNGLEVSNDGNINISVQLQSSADADSFIGGDSSVNSFKIKAVSSSCDGTDNLASYTEVTGAQQAACDDWNFGETMQIDFELVIPEDAVGTHGTVITATGAA